jgi:hypothetical protein
MGFIMIKNHTGSYWLLFKKNNIYLETLLSDKRIKTVSLLESTCLPTGRETRLDSNYLKNRDILK